MSKQKNGDKEKQTATPSEVATIPGGDLLAPAPLPEAARIFLEGAIGPRESAEKLPLVGIMHKEGTFKMPSGELAQEISGYPVYVFRTRRFYKRPPQIGAKGGPPDCWSADLVTPHSTSLEMQAATCAECVQNQFGTGRDGRSKACGEFTWTVLLNREFGRPPLAVVVTPPSSIMSLWGNRFTQGYFSQASKRNGAYEITWTTFRLKMVGDVNRDPIVYCTIDPVMGPAADPKDVPAIVEIRNRFLKLMDELRMRTAEPEGEPAQ